MGTRWADGYSAKVELSLMVNGEKLRVAQVGPSSLILRDKREIPADTAATLVIKIDDREQQDEIVLFEGASPSVTRVKYF